jgi:Zn-dependent protease
LSIESGLIFLVLLIISLSVHEAAHAWTADRLGDPTARMLGRLTLNPLAHIDWIGTVLFPLLMIYSNAPLLGWAKPVPVNMNNLRHPRRDFALVAVAGPVSNLLQGLVSAMLLMSLTRDEVVMASDLTPAGLAFQFLILNISLAVFNMLPVPPLDGGNVLAGILPEAGARLIDALRPYGFLVLYALLLTGVLGNVMFPIIREIVGWLT